MEGGVEILYHKTFFYAYLKKGGEVKFIIVFLYVLISTLFSAPNLIAPATVRVIDSTNVLWDKIEVTTYLQNTGDSTAWSPLYPSSYTAVSIRIDSLYRVGSHSIYYLQSGYFISFKDTFTVMKGPFALSTWCDPLGFWGENGSGKFDNVLSWSYNFHSEISYDTVYVITKDTLTLHDTTSIHDTVAIYYQDTLFVHDTVYIYDTLKTSSQRAIAKTYVQNEFPSRIYNIMGQLVWTGNCQIGKIPPLNLSQGRYVLIQGSKRSFLKVVLK